MDQVCESGQAGAEIDITPQMLRAGYAIFDLEGGVMSKNWLANVFAAMICARSDGYDAAVERYPFVRG